MLRTNALARETSASREAVRQLDGIGCRYRATLKTKLMSGGDRKNPMVDVEESSAEQVISDWLYFGAAHWDEEKAERVNQWSKVGYEFSLSKAVIAVLNVYWELDLLIQGLLNEDSPVSPLAGHSSIQV
jgi:hypothetical protein